MFKIEVNVLGKTHGHYWMNKHEDDFIRFLPKHFTRVYGEEITKDDLKIYLIEESKMDLLEGKINQSEFNELDFSQDGKILLKRYHKAVYKDGEFVKLQSYLSTREDRENTARGSKNPQIITHYPTIKHDFGNGVEDAIKIIVGNELINDFNSTELELVGIEMKNSFPYKTVKKTKKNPSGIKFLGNK